MIKWDNPDFRSVDIEYAVQSLNGYIGGNGPIVEEFETKFAKKVGSKYAVATNNATTALVASCMVLRHIHGDLRIGVPSFTFIASANSAKFVFDNVKFLDVDSKTWNVSNENIKDVDALISVDVGGLSCDYDELSSLNIPIIADSAESAGSKYKGNYVGTQALMHCFSFHRSKIISCGEGGMVTTNNEEVYKLLKSYCNHGYDLNKKSYQYIHKTLGLNFRMTDVNAALGVKQLERLDEYVNHRQQIAKIYDETLHFLNKQEYDKQIYDNNYFLYGVLVDPKMRDSIVEKMLSNEIITKTWSSIASQECYSQIDPINCKTIADSVILLPIHNQLTVNEAEHVANKLKTIIC